MRIPCAKCGHLHDSTVTPLMHDIVKEDNDFDKKVIPRPSPDLPDLVAYGKYKMTEFKCGKCGSINYLMLMWSVMEKEGAAEDTE